MRRAPLPLRLVGLLLAGPLCCGWVWPLEPRPRVVAGFDAPAGPYGPGHRGADLTARVGQPVRAAGAGVVAFAGSVAGRGVVSVAHPDGRRTTYEPVSAAVRAGDPVAEGQVIGTVSAAPGHCLPGTCLHWGLRVAGTYADPLTLLGAVPVRLLPVWGVAGAAGPGGWPPAAGLWPASRRWPAAGLPSAAGLPPAAAPPARDRGPLLARG